MGWWIWPEIFRREVRLHVSHAMVHLISEIYFVSFVARVPLLDHEGLDGDHIGWNWVIEINGDILVTLAVRLLLVSKDLPWIMVVVSSVFIHTQTLNNLVSRNQIFFGHIIEFVVYNLIQFQDIPQRKVLLLQNGFHGYVQWKKVQIDTQPGQIV